jgi:Flp pilus assembly protein TadB
MSAAGTILADPPVIDTLALSAMLAGALLGVGIFVLIEALIGRPASAAQESRPSLVERYKLADSGQQLLIGLIAAVLTLVITRWVTATIAAFALGFFGRSLIGGAASARSEMVRLEALATWTESLRDTIAGAVGLEQAIPATYLAAPPVIRTPLALLIDRLRTREPLADALVKFANDLKDPSADLIIAALILNARLRGPGLRDVLGALSASAREELDMRQRIDAARKATRRSVQIIVGITLVVVLGMTLLNRAYVAPYDSPQGQLVLVVIFALFGAGFLWLRRLAQFEVPARFLTGSVRDTDSNLPSGTQVVA